MSPQTPRPPAPNPTPDRRLARDVAKHLDRRQIRRKLFFWALLVTAIVLAALYLTCGQGFGLGGKGKGKGAGSGAGPGSVQPLLSPPVDAGPIRCEVRVAANGITVDGKPATVDEAVAACKDAIGTDVLVTGGARQGDWEDLKAAFERAGIRYQRVEPGSTGPGSSTRSGAAGGGSGG
jgi:hypothetical protein